jgi:hypothetical protein
LRVLDGQHGGAGLGGFADGAARDLQVQLDELFHAFEGLLGQAEEGLDVGLLGGDDLVSGEVGHGELL